MSYKKTSLLSFALSVVALAMADNYQIFTDQSGREIEAKIIRILPGGEKITVQRKGQTKQITVPLVAFNDATKKMISDWSKDSNFLNSSLLAIELDLVKNKSADKSSSFESDNYDGSSSTSYTEIRYFNHHVKIDLNNKLDQTFENVQLEYVLFYMQEASNQKKNRDGRTTNIYDKNLEQQGTLYHKETITIPSNSKSSFETKGIMLLRKNFGSSSIIPPIDGEFEGAIIRLTLPSDSGNPIMREIRYPEKLKHSWITKTKDVQSPAP